MISSAVQKHCRTLLSIVAAIWAIPGPASAVEHQWAWIKGDDKPTTVGVYGELGVPAEANNPRGMGFPAKWTDLEGNIWIYGGANNYNTMWKFDNSTRNWTWMAGTSTPLVVLQPVYGEQGEEGAANTPGARIKMTAWTGPAGDLWLYGGVAGIRFSDLWKFNTRSLKWTCVYGSNQVNQPAVYGQIDVPAPENNPGGRYGSAGWVDEQGDFWLFGGSAAVGGLLHDLWRYDVSSGQWIWSGGTQTGSAAPVYGTQGVASPDNIPSGRTDSATWCDGEGNFWLFGGLGKAFHSNGSTTYTVGMLNDLWKYDPRTGEWTWMNGSQFIDQPSIHGTLRVPDPDNQPSGRFNIGAIVDRHNQAWIMGGYNNELWCYNIDHNVWTWVHGNLSGTLYSIVYGSLGVAAPENTPGVRYGHVKWLDPQGNILLFGGYSSFDPTNHIPYIHLNDLWTITPGNFAIPSTVESWQLFQ